MNDVVDLGYRGQEWTQLNGVYDAATQDAYWVDIRTRIFDKMDEVGPDDWEVSPIFAWTQGADNGVGIVIKHLDGAGNPTGREWLLTMPVIDSVGFGTVNLVYESNAEFHNYFRDGINATASSYGAGGIALHYHTGGLSTTYDLTGVVNDLDTPTNTPGADLSVFMPDFATVPHPWGGIIHDSQQYDLQHKWCMVFNHEVPFIGIYYCENEEGDGVSQFAIAGDIIVPRDTGDAYVEGGVYGDVETLSSDDTLTLNYSLVTFLTSTGQQAAAIDLHPHEQFGLGNSPVRPEASLADCVPVLSTGANNEPGPPTVKGWIRRDVMTEQGWEKAQHYRIFDCRQGKKFKISAYHAIPWVTAPEPVPFSGWPLNPQELP